MKNLLSISVFLFFISCERFIDLDLPKDQLITETVFNDPMLANAAMAGLYRSLDQSGYLSGGFIGGGLYLGCYSDELVSYQSAGSDLYDLYHQVVTPQSNAAAALWGISYNQIYQANSMISGLQASSSISVTLREQLQGEALFVRALLHYYLLQTYGDIPYVTSTDYNINRTLKKLPSAEVYFQIEKDLSQVHVLLPGNTPAGQRFRPSKEAVKLLQSRVALAQGKWQEVIDATGHLVSNTQYQLQSQINSAYLKNNPSTVWQFSPANSSSITQEAGVYTLYFAPPFVAALSPQLIQSFDQNDLRLQNWIGAVEDFMGIKYYYPKKYKQTMIIASQDEYSIVLRSEEAVLNRAEALAQLGFLDLSVGELNKIVSRAGLTPVTQMSQSDLLNRILVERRHELFSEYGHRFFDLKRASKLDAAMATVKPQWKSFYQLFPLPEKEILLNPNLNPQNDGY